MKFTTLATLDFGAVAPARVRAHAGRVDPAAAYYSYPQAHARSRQQYVRAAVPPSQCVLAIDGTYMTPDLCSSGTRCGWKYKCNGNGSCTLAADGTYATQEACLPTCSRYSCGANGAPVADPLGPFTSVTDVKCFTCGTGNVCGAVSMGGMGEYSTQQECMDDPVRKCGWKYACASTADGGSATSFTKLVPSYQGTYATEADARCVTNSSGPGPACTCVFAATEGKFATVNACKADPTAQCGWQYACVPPLTFSYVNATARFGVGNTVFDYMAPVAAGAGNEARTSTASLVRTGRAKGWSTPQYAYLAIGTPFIAYGNKATVAIVQVGMTALVSMTSFGADSDLVRGDIVLVGYGNFKADTIDPNMSGNTTITSPVQNGGSGKTVVQPYSVVGASAAGEAGRGNTARFSPALTATLIPGYQYQLYARFLLQTDDDATMTWPALQLTVSTV
jgi:hypothetical protein